jgi:putative ATPase
MEKEKNIKNSPLADRMRPKNLNEFVGQGDIVGEGKMLRLAIESDQIPSILFWGPPGTGKTTLAHIIAEKTNSEFLQLSAVTSGLKELRAVISEAKANQIEGKKTILFIDEIHRWNKKQQDALLPQVEQGIITLIGATTENPSFEVISALMSRCRVFVLKSLESEHIKILIERALNDKERGLKGENITVEDDAKNVLSEMSNGDARTALNILEFAASISKKITLDIIKEAFQKSHLMYDKNGEEHYNIISALHKSMRGSDPDAALYYLARMLEAGEDPLYIARRLVRFASEDIGLANSRALEQAVAAYQACHFMGMPECNVVLSQAVVYMAKCEKSNALYTAYKKAAQDVRDKGNLGVPLHLRNAPTKFMKNLGYGKDYKYSPDYNYKDKQDYLPEEIKGRKYF